MKNKSSRHKETNVFKFLPFSERINNLEVNVYHKIGHENEIYNEDESECLFYLALQKWSVLNLSEGFSQFKKEIGYQNLVTLPQLIHNKEIVVEVLLKYLKLKDVLFLQPICSLTASLAEDLRKDFYPYFPKFLAVLIDLLHSKDVDQIEWVFTCLAYIFKFLWRSLSKDITVVFESILPLLSDSKPEYINNFAAESFSFVARKVNDVQTFLDMILETVQLKKDSIIGCGKLIFGVIHGSKGQFHSCAECWLLCLFRSLFNNKYPRRILFEILKETVSNILQDIQPSNGEIFWKSAIIALKELNTVNEEACENLLKLIYQSVKFKNGIFLKKSSLLTNQIVQLLKSSETSENCFVVIVDLCVVLLKAKHVQLTQEQASQLIQNVQSLNNQKIYLIFIENLIDYNGFELQILPNFLRRSVDLESGLLNQAYLRSLTKILLKKVNFCESGVVLNSWKKYFIDFPLIADNELIVENLVNNLNLQNEENYFCATVYLPHTNFKNTKIDEKLKENCETLLDTILQLDDGKKIKRKLYLLLCTIQCLILTDNIQLIDHKKLIQNLLPYINKANFVESLKILDLFFTASTSNEELMNYEVLLMLHEKLEENFNSPYHKIRLLTSHIYSLFEKIDYFLEKSNDFKENWKVFSICFSVESTEFQVQTFKEQLQQLEKLSFEKLQISMCKSTVFLSVPLRYLCGLLYVNFQLLWNPISKLIATYASGMEINSFWSIFGEQFKQTNYYIHSLIKSEFREEIFEEFFTTIVQIQDKPDFLNYRILLWKTVVEFPAIGEARTRDTSVLLLNFIEKEYISTTSDFAKTWDIKEHNSNTGDQIENSKRSDEINEDTTVNEEVEKKLKYSIKVKEKTMISILTVFSKVNSPKSMYQEPELKKLYLDLLSHKNSEIQKLALDCLMTYRQESLTAYKVYLYDLIDDKNFKNQLALFRIDTESPVVKIEHREELIPIIIKIVFSKMTSKIGLRTGGKGSGQLRRNLVLRFLSGCQENEIQNFVQMTFKVYANYFEKPIESIWQECDLEKFIPPKKLQSSVNLLEVIFEEFGCVSSKCLLEYLLKVLIVIGAHLKGALAQISDVHVGYREVLRKLRSSCIKVLERFFDHFEKYSWSPEEIDSIFEVFVWPYLPKLEIEGIHSPTSLLKLISQWASKPRYFPLFLKYQGSDQNVSVMPFVMNLLINKATNNSVSKVIIELVNNLLRLDDKEEEEFESISVNNSLPLRNEKIPTNFTEDSNLNSGSLIIMPYIPFVLEKLKVKLQKSKKGLNFTELSVLSRISELVWDSELSSAVLELIIPLFSRLCHSSEETVIKFTTTINNLIKTVEMPQKYILKLLPFLGEISCKSARKQMCQLLFKIASKTGLKEHETLANLINELNAYNDKWIDEPNFERRSKAYKDIKALLETDFGMELGLAIIFNCYYTVRYENDISLKEHASQCWKNTSVALLKRYKNKNSYILDENLFVLIRKGLKDNKNPDFRNEVILLLGHLARECSDVHVVLKDLNKLTNKVDLEVDFFENITHLQVHRHVRALLKFVEIFNEENTKGNSRTLLQFVCPLASWYLCNEKFVSKNSLIDASIEVVKVVCKKLSWNHYANLLKFFMDKLRYKSVFQKQLVRVIVAILDSFHYDVTNGLVNDVVEETNEEKVEEQKQDENAEVLAKIKEENDIEKKEENIEEGNDVEEKENIEEENDIEEKENIEKQVVDIFDDDAVAEGENEIDLEEKHNNNNGVIVLTKSAAKKVILAIQKMFLPQLQKLLTEYTPQIHSAHKLNKKKTLSEREEDDLQRIPISLALVKLLQKLPKSILDNNLPRIFMKLATFLKSQLESVRRIARQTFEQILCAVGPKYLTDFLDTIQPLLSKGFQAYVLVYTVHGVLGSLKHMYESGDVDLIVATATKMCAVELFGSMAEEKEVEKIRTKTPEAKTTRSYETLQLLSVYVTEKCLLDLILPFKSILFSSRSLKNIHKLQECFRNIALGLVANKFLSSESLLKFTYGVASQTIPELFPNETNNVQGNKQQEKLLEQKKDCFLIDPAPRDRSHARKMSVKNSDNMNNYVLVTFGLNISFNLVKNDGVKDENYKQFLDPFIKLFKESLNSQHVKLNIMALKCLIGVSKYNLPSFQDNITDITETVFKILHKYAVSGLNKGDNFDLVLAAFKFMSILLRDVKNYSISEDQLKMLVFYIEQDLYENGRQINALMLLKTILARKLIVTEIHDVMNRVAKMSIISESPQIRDYCRQIFLRYFMDYPLGKKLNSYINFYLSQINYELISGRESALEMIKNFIHAFPRALLKKQCATIMVAVGPQLINDDSPECRKMVASCLTKLLLRLTKASRNSLFDMIMIWLKDEKVNHRRLAAQLCGIFVTVEKLRFESRLPTLLPVLLNQFSFKVVSIKTDSSEENPEQRIKDHYLFQTLQLMLKLCSYCPAFLKKTEEIEILASYSQSLLGYSHEWVRLGASQFIGFVLSHMDIDRLAELIQNGNTETKSGYMFNDPVTTLKTLTLDLSAQLQTNSENEQLIEQIVKNLVFISRILQKIENGDETTSLLDLPWLIKRMRKISNYELIHSPKTTIARKSVFKWIAGVATVLEQDKVESISQSLLYMLVREMSSTDSGNDDSLKQLAKEVALVVKKRIGDDKYATELGYVKQNLNLRRAERKRVGKQLAVADSELHAKKKIKKNLKKKELKKKKVAVIKGRPVKKGQKRKFSAIEED